MAGTSVEMTAEGSSDSWENNKANQIRLANAFLKHISNTDSALMSKWGDDWSSIPEEHACSCELYGHFATFLVNVYKKNNDKHLELGGVIAAWGGVIFQASQKFKASTRPETKDFFECLRGDNCPQVQWYRGLKQKMTRMIFERKMFLDEPMDNSANEIYLEHVRDLSAAFSLAGTLESAERKLAIKTLWRAGGRGGEAACVSYMGIKWNSMHHTACLECPQPKTSKLKLIPYVAGIDRHSDWLLDFGDLLVLQRGSTMWTSDKKTFLADAAT